MYDPVRRRMVAATPEELVRQKLLRRMLNDLGYPPGLIAVEMYLGSPQRRADIVCYRSSMQPLLVIECKAKELSQEAEEQAFGYNASLGAPFVCLAGKDALATLWFDGQKIARVPYLPTYKELCAAVS